MVKLKGPAFMTEKLGNLAINATIMHVTCVVKIQSFVKTRTLSTVIHLCKYVLYNYMSCSSKVYIKCTFKFTLHLFAWLKKAFLGEADDYNYRKRLWVA